LRLPQVYVVRTQYPQLIGAKYFSENLRALLCSLNTIPMNYIDSTSTSFVPAKLDEPETKTINPVQRALISAVFSPAVGATLLQIIYVPT
jgi:hypothetical protein